MKYHVKIIACLVVLSLAVGGVLLFRRTSDQMIKVVRSRVEIESENLNVEISALGQFPMGRGLLLKRKEEWGTKWEFYAGDELVFSRTNIDVVGFNTAGFLPWEEVEKHLKHFHECPVVMTNHPSDNQHSGWIVTNKLNQRTAE